MCMFVVLHPAAHLALPLNALHALLLRVVLVLRGGLPALVLRGGLLVLRGGLLLARAQRQRLARQ
eukprot:5006669-Pyramimonas_sp.AAC.1